VSLTVLHDDVQDFVCYVNGYYRLQATAGSDGDGDEQDGDDGLVVRTVDQRNSSSSSENGLILSFIFHIHYDAYIVS